jgi:hypothetical protein
VPSSIDTETPQQQQQQPEAAHHRDDDAQTVGHGADLTNVTEVRPVAEELLTPSYAEVVQAGHHEKEEGESS